MDTHAYDPLKVSEASVKNSLYSSIDSNTYAEVGMIAGISISSAMANAEILLIVFFIFVSSVNN